MQRVVVVYSVLAGLTIDVPDHDSINIVSGSSTNIDEFRFVRFVERPRIAGPSPRFRPGHRVIDG